MTNPYFLTILLYLALAILEALDASLISYNLLPWFNGVRWLRVHFITLGVMTQLVFALLPNLVAARARLSQPRLPQPRFRWDVWLSLNLGIPILLIGMPSMNLVLILAGGTLVFIAAALLTWHLYHLHPAASPAENKAEAHQERKFYLAGLIYFLVGIIIGTGIWLGWAIPLAIRAPIETHIHANNWGLMSLVFAGLIFDLYPKFAHRPLAWPRSMTPIFWLMTVGAFGLVAGPWTGWTFFTIPGLVLHLTATIWLVLNMVKPLWGDRPAWTPGMAHLISSYFWLIAPLLMAPLILLKIPGFPTLTVEQNAPQALIYGWVLQFGYALIPYFFRLFLQPEQPARLGGNWFSLITMHFGGVFLWTAIFIEPYFGLLHGTAYGLWMLSLGLIAREVWQIVREKVDERSPQLELN
jgi:hypothetical protein